MKDFEFYLKGKNLSQNTVLSYVGAVKQFFMVYGEINRENLLSYKGYLLEKYSPKTVNLRIQGINKYLDFIKQDKMKLKAVKVQQKNFLENVISNADYEFLKRKLKKDGKMEWYFVVRYLTATGVRISELIQIKTEHIQAGFFDVYSKGGKMRRLYIPKDLSL